MTLGQRSIQYQWTVTVREACRAFFVLGVFDDEDVDGLFTTQADPIDTLGVLKQTFTIDFAVNDFSDITRARTREINFGLKFAHTDGDFNW